MRFWLAIVLIFATLTALLPQAPPDPAIRTYSVTNAAAFPALNGPRSMLVFRNGLFESPGVDYTLLTAGDGVTRFAFRPGTLANGDRIAVVTMPGVFMVDEPLYGYQVGGMPHIGISLPALPAAAPAKTP